MGKRQIADMQPSELVVTLIISEIAAIPIQDSRQPVFSAVAAIFTLTAFELITAFLSLKSSLINNLTNGKSAMIIKNGEILQHRLKKMRVTVADIIELLREQGIFDISEVSYAYLETNGKLSVLQKPFFRPARYGDVKRCEIETDGCPSLVISDGTLLRRGLEDIVTDENTVRRLLENRGLSIEDVFIMTLDDYENCVVIEKEKNL